MGRDVLHGTGEVSESASDDARRGGEGNGETSKDESSREFKRFLHNQRISSSSDAPPGLRGSLLSVRFRADPHFFSSFFAIALSMVSTSDNSPRSPYLSPKRDTRPALVITAVLTPWKKGWLPDQMSTQGRLACSDLAADQDKATVRIHAIQQMRQGFTMAITHVEIVRIGRNRKGRFTESEIVEVFVV